MTGILKCIDCERKIQNVSVCQKMFSNIKDVLFRFVRCFHNLLKIIPCEIWKDRQIVKGSMLNPIPS